MKNGTKTALTVCLILAIVGFVCIGAGLLLGGKLSFQIDTEKHTLVSSSAELVSGEFEPEPFTKLDIQVATADITVERGETWSLSYTLSEEPEITQENGVLKLEGQEHGSIGFVGIHFSAGNAPFVKLTVPADAALEEITLATATGDVTLSDLTADKLELSCATGDIRLESITAQTLLLAANTGDLVLRNVSTTEQAKLSTNTGDVDAELTAPGGVKAESNTGDVSLTLKGAAKDFGLSLETDLGDVTVDGRDEGHSCTTSGGIPVRAETNTGDVTVRFG